MNKIWGAIILISLIAGIALGNSASLTTAVIDAATEAVKLLISIGSMMCLWSGIMNIAQKSGLTDLLAKLFSPVISRLFPDYSANKEVMGAISMNITANMLGLGNAATPFGIAAMKSMVKYSPLKKGNANKSIITFVVLNTASIQLIPTTVSALRRAAGSNTPMDILPYVWICSACALAAGLTAVQLFSLFKKEK